MAKRHSDDAGQKAQLNRRDYLRLGGAAVGATALGVGATTPVAAAPETVVDLGQQGLSNGDEIDPYLEQYVDNGVEVRVPEGEYDWNGEGFTGATSDAAIVGQGEVILNNIAGEYYQTIKASGTLEIRNFTIRGAATGNSSRFRLDADSEGRIVIDNLNFPDGSEDGAEAKAFYAPRDHAGVIEIRNCYLANFDDNGIYASSPGYEDGAGGQVIVENCTAHNNNIAGIRVGSTDSIVRNCLVINDDEAPASQNGGVINQRGIRVRAPGENLVIEDCEIIHSYEGAGSPIQLHRTAEGGSGTINNVRILNNSDSTAIADQDGNTAQTWTGTNISITGNGDLGYPSNFEVTTGSSAAEPTGEDPQGDTTTSSDNTDSTDSGSSDSDSTGSGDSGNSDSSGGSSGSSTGSTDSGSSEAPAGGSDRLLVTTAPSNGASYEFTATGEIIPRYDLTQDKADDDSMGESATQNEDGTWTGTGALSGSGSSGDSFDVAGDITAFSIDGDSGAVSLLLNGTEVSMDDLISQSSGDDQQPDDGSSDGGSADDGSSDDGSSDDGELSNVLLIDGTVTNGLAQYKIVVSGGIERSESLSSTSDSPWDGIDDRVDESTATGVVAKGLDGYRFSGELVSFQVKGHVDLTVEQAES